MLPLRKVRPDLRITTGAQVPGEAHRAVEIQGVGAVLLAEHSLDRRLAHYLSAVVAALGKQHLDELADLPGCCP
ncbi:hypothetical protein D3C75_1336460 [compost metagenome]